MGLIRETNISLNNGKKIQEMLLGLGLMEDLFTSLLVYFSDRVSLLPRLTLNSQCAHLSMITMIT